MATNSLSKMAAATLFLFMSIFPGSVAVTYTVGDANQWASGVNYTFWVTGKTFRIGDILEFKYGPTHSVDVVDKAGYDGCDVKSATESHLNGDTKIELKTVGTRYFICSTPGHCINGMKLAVTVIASPSSTDTPPPPSAFPVSPPPPTPPPPSPVVPPPTPNLPRSDGIHEAESGSTTPPPPPPSPPPPSSGASRGLMSYVVVGISLVLACNVWMMDYWIIIIIYLCNGTSSYKK